jgi:hypothetical protein
LPIIEVIADRPAARLGQYLPIIPGYEPASPHPPDAHGRIAAGRSQPLPIR